MTSPLFLFLGDLGGGELMLIMVVILIFFGANKIPELARGLGKGIREFKDASREIRSEIENADRPQQPYQQQFNQQPYQQPVEQQPYHSSHPVTDAPAVTPVAPPMDGGITPPVAPTPTEERPRLDQTH